MESPCILICSIEMETGWCHGCGRTRDEIADWTKYTDEKRAELMAAFPARVAQLEKRPRKVTKRQRLAEAKKATP